MSFTASLPREFGHYLLLETLGHGATATVFRATDQRSGREVAVKVITRASELGHKRFQRELETLSRLQHRHIVACHDGGIIDGRPFLAMDYVAGGRSLEELSQRDDLLPLDVALRVLRETARAIEHAHQAGVLHRDLKPANILVDPSGRARVLDFGVASLLEAGDGERLTRTGFLVGTPAYMAPEQARGEACVESDVFALGATLYHAVTGLHPYEDQGINPLLAQNQRPTSASGLRPDLPAGVEALLQRCMAPAIEDRFPSAGAVAQALDDELELLKSGGEPARPGSPVLLVGLPLATAAVIGLAAWAVTRSAPSPEPAASRSAAPSPRPTQALRPVEERFAEAVARWRESVTAFDLPRVEVVRRAHGAARELATSPELRRRFDAVGTELARELERRALAWTARALPYDPRVDAALGLAAELARHDRSLQTRIHLTRVDVLLRRGMYTEAERAIAALPTEGQVGLRKRFYRAMVIHRLGRKAEAKEILEALQREDPDGVAGRTATGRLLSRAWKYNESNRILAQVVEQDPTWRPAQHLLALGLSFRSQGAEARDVLAPALRAAPDDYRTHNMLAFAWMHHDVERSLAAFDAALRLGGERASTIKWRGIVAMRGSKLTQARRDLDRAMELKPDADTRIWRGLVHWRQGNRGLAAEDWRAAYRERPTSIRKRLGDMPPNLRQTIWRIATGAE